jgi:hypothetical protein
MYVEITFFEKLLEISVLELSGFFTKGHQKKRYQYWFSRHICVISVHKCQKWFQICEYYQ